MEVRSRTRPSISPEDARGAQLRSTERRSNRAAHWRNLLASEVNLIQLYRLYLTRITNPYTMRSMDDDFEASGDQIRNAFTAAFGPNPTLSRGRMSVKEYEINN